MCIRDSFGSARIPSKGEAKEALENHSDKTDNRTIAKLKMDLKMSRYYEEARSLANKFTSWSKNLKDSKHRYIICSGGGPGIMEAANRGASEANGINVGLTISLPFEASENEWISDDLNLNFEKQNHIFIVGMPRSGSTLVESILSLNDDVFDLGESEALPNSYNKWKKNQDKYS